MKSRSPITYFAIAQSFWNFAQSMTVSLPCSEQNFTTTGLLGNTLCANDIISWEAFWTDIQYCTEPQGSIVSSPRWHIITHAITYGAIFSPHPLMPLVLDRGSTDGGDFKTVFLKHAEEMVNKTSILGNILSSMSWSNVKIRLSQMAVVLKNPKHYLSYKYRQRSVLLK